MTKILYALDVWGPNQLITAMDTLRAADIADLLEQINPYDRGRLVRPYDCKFDGEILTKLQEGLPEEIIGLLKPGVLANASRNLETDDLWDLFQDF